MQLKATSEVLESKVLGESRLIQDALTQDMRNLADDIRHLQANILAPIQGGSMSMTEIVELTVALKTKKEERR